MRRRRCLPSEHKKEKGERPAPQREVVDDAAATGVVNRVTSSINPSIHIQPTGRKNSNSSKMMMNIRPKSDWWVPVQVTCHLGKWVVPPTIVFQTCPHAYSQKKCVSDTFPSFGWLIWHNRTSFKPPEKKIHPTSRCLTWSSVAMNFVGKKKKKSSCHLKSAAQLSI